MTSKKTDIIELTPLEKTHPLVMILWTDITYDKTTKKTIFYDRFFVRNFKLSKFLADKTNASVKKFEKNISGLYCDKCTVWESYLRGDELKIILKNCYDPKGRFSSLINNICNTTPITDMDDQNVICIDLRRPEVNGKEKVYLSDGSSMVFGKAADYAAYSEYRQKSINGMKKYYSKSFETIHPNNMRDLVERINNMTTDKKILDDVKYYYDIIDNYRYLNIMKIKTFEELKEITANVMYAQKFIQHTYNTLSIHSKKVERDTIQRKTLMTKGYNENFPSL